MKDALKDVLQDIVQHTHNLGVIDLIKINGSDKDTVISAIGQDKSLVMDARFHTPVAEFIGVFGMPNLGKLNVILNIPEYREDAAISVVKQDSEPAGISFVNKGGDFKNSYRFMDTKTVNSKLPTVSLKTTIQWDVEVEPSVNSIQRLRFQTQANSEEITFIATTNNNNLDFSFGTPTTHAGNFTFSQGISGKLSGIHTWPIAVFNSILALPGDKMMRFSERQGIGEITVDSGIALYNYKIPALKK